MAKYKGSVELISGLIQKNGGTFPLIDASAVQVDDTGKRLDAKLAEIGTGSGSGAAFGIKPEDYGAKGDGVTDDHDALVSAMNAAVAAKLPMTLTQGKTYCIKSGLSLIGNLTIEGNGAAIITDIAGMTGSDRRAIQLFGSSAENRHENVVIRNLTLKAADTCTSNYMLTLARSRNVTLSHMTFDCEINTQSRSTLDLYGINENILIENCRFNQLSSAYEGGVWVRSWSNQAESRNIRILNCDFYKAGGDEILAAWGWKGTIRDVLISGCNFYDAEDSKYWTNPSYYPRWFITLGQSGTIDVRFENNVVRTTHCECLFRMLGDNNHMVVDNCDFYIGQDAMIPQHDMGKGANMMLAQGNDNPQKSIIRNCRGTFQGDSGRRLTYRFGTVENCTFQLQGLGGIFASTKMVRNNILSGDSIGGGFNDCERIIGNRINLTNSNFQLFAGYSAVENNEIEVDFPTWTAKGLPLCGNNSNWDKTIFSGNRVTWTCSNESILRKYQYPDTWNYVFDNRFYTTNGRWVPDNLSGYVFRKNNYFNGLPEKLFPCTGVSFNESEIEVNYKKKMTALADILPENCTDPVIYTFTGGDELLTLSGHGKYVAKADGTVTVTATCGSYDATQKIKVRLLPAPCESLKLSRDTVKTAVGRKTYIKALYEPYWTTDALTFSSDDEETVSITQNGEITANKNGTTTIRATCGDKTAECTVSVVDESELPVYYEGTWLLDNTVAYVPLPSVGENHTLYIEMTVDLDTIAGEGGYVRLLGTYANGEEVVDAPITLAYQKSGGYPTYDWGTVESMPSGGEAVYSHVNYVNTGVFSEEEGAKIRFLFKPDGVYNVNADKPLWETLQDKRNIQPYSGYMSFNVEIDGSDAKVQTFASSAELKAALEAGSIHASASKGYKITRFILYSHDIYTTTEDILNYREGADIDIRFDANGMPVNAGTSGTLVWSSGDSQADIDATSSNLGTAKLGTMKLK